jgi:nucleoside-diphosphate-sugar epimerase
MRAKGQHLGIYHIGNIEEVTIADLAQRISRTAGRDIDLVCGPPMPGSVPRRCPDISRLVKLGYKPRVPLDEGLEPTLDWYWSHADLAPKN